VDQVHNLDEGRLLKALSTGDTSHKGTYRFFFLLTAIQFKKILKGSRLQGRLAPFQRKILQLDLSVGSLKSLLSSWENVTISPPT